MNSYAVWLAGKSCSVKHKRAPIFADNVPVSPVRCAQMFYEVQLLMFDLLLFACRSKLQICNSLNSSDSYKYEHPVHGCHSAFGLESISEELDFCGLRSVSYTFVFPQSSLIIFGILRPRIQDFKMARFKSVATRKDTTFASAAQIGRASCRERV